MALKTVEAVRTVACLLALLAFSQSTFSAGLAVSQHLEPGSPANFSLPDADGTIHALSTHRGGWVVVNFWATWCGPCVREMPALQNFAHHNDSVTMIGVNFEEISKLELAAALNELNIDYVNVQVGDKPLVPFEPLVGLPSTFLVAPDGTLVYRHTGEVTEDALRDALDEARRRFVSR